ncbi:MAG: gliding motility-associated C-terminal domain-containing protein [Bacteroidia bacterium]|nr:gliding motility-associated C-terminal domain-containing protein [Bacteroidia bacterium]
MKIYIIALCFASLNIFSQTDCLNADAFCANNTSGTTFPAGTGGSAAAGPDYGCLGSQPNPAWYFFQVSQSGVITIGISGTGGFDVDFICWGPFTNPTGNCGNLTAGNTVDCSFSSSATETCTINNAIAGQYYQLLLTNYSNQPQNINFNQIGGTGATNCGLIAPVTSATVCSGQTATITANTNLTNPTYVWSPGGMTTASIVVSPASTTIYTVTVSGLNAASTPTTITNTGTVTINTAAPITVANSAAAICSGQSSVLSSSGAGPFVWTASSGASPAASGTVTVTPTTTTTYTVVSGVGTCTSSAVTTVSVTTTPTISITPSVSAICLGQSSVLTASGVGPFTWTASSGTTPPSVGTVTVTPTTTSTYTVLSGTGACTTTASATVSIITTPSISITPSVSAICLGQSSVLTASGVGPFIWTASAGATPPAVGTVTVSPSVTTTYTVLSGTGACTTTAVATVSISLTPSISITPSFSTICLGQSVTLTSSGSAPFVWTASTGTTPASAATVTVSPTTTTTYTVLSGTGACTATAVATVSISLTPSISITPSLSTICLGETVTLTSTGSAPFVWTASSGTNPTGSATVVVTPSTTTTYTVLSGAGTCTTTAFATVSISIVPPITITPSVSAICAGSSQTLTASGVGPFVWTASSGTTPPASGTVVVTPGSTTSYTVLSGTGACTTTAIAIVSITATPSIAITPAFTTLCLGESTTLTSGGAAPYVWTASSGTNPASAGSVTVTPTTTTTYTVLSGSGTCTATAVATVSIAPALSITITPSLSTICNGQSTALSSTGAGPFAWTASSGTNPSPTSTVTVNPLTTTTYTVLSGTGACTAQAVATISVLPIIDPMITASSPTVCLTKTVTLTAPFAAGLTYSWSPALAISGATNTFSINAVPPTTATVIYTVTVYNGVCSDDDTIQLKVKTAPDIINFTTLNNDTICVGGCVTFSATTTGSQPILYQWYYQSGVGTSSVGVAPEACYPSAGTFSVVSTASNTCGVDTLIKTDFVTVFDLPVVIVGGDTTINIGETAEIYASGGVSYSWSPNINGSIACPTCSITTVTPTLTTEYIVVVSNSPYCKVQDTVTVIVDINCGDFFIPNVFSPNGDGLNDMINVHGRCITTFNLQIFNRWGEKVFETSSLSESWDGTFRGQKLDTGVFVYKADGISIDGQEFKLKGNITLIR